MHQYTDVGLFLYILMLPKSLILEKNGFNVWGLESVLDFLLRSSVYLNFKIRSDFTMLISLLKRRNLVQLHKSEFKDQHRENLYWHDCSHILRNIVREVLLTTGRSVFCLGFEPV